MQLEDIHHIIHSIQKEKIHFYSKYFKSLLYINKGLKI